MSFRTAFILALRAAGVPDALVLDALLAAEAAERDRRRLARLARLSKMNEQDSVAPPVAAESSPQIVPASVGGPVKDRARRGLGLAEGLRPAARAVGMVLVEFCNLRTGRCDPGIKRIIERTRLSRRSVTRALGQLEAAGLVRRVVHGGLGHANAYGLDWEAMARLSPVAAKMNEQDSGLTGTLVSAEQDTRVVQNLSRNLQSPKRGSRTVAPDHRQGWLKLPIPGKAAVAASSAEGRLWHDVQRHFASGGPQAIEAVTLKLLEGGLGERAAQAEAKRQGNGLRMVLDVMREAG